MRKQQTATAFLLYDKPTNHSDGILMFIYCEIVIPLGKDV